MRAVGIDAGSRHFGFAVVTDDNGDIRVLDFGQDRVPDGSVVSECAWAFDFVEALARKWSPQVWGLEYSHFKGMGNGAIVGASLASMAKAGGDVKLIYPSRARAIVVGKGNATKQTVKRFLRLYGLPEQASTHAADAATAALAALIIHRSPLK